MKTNIDTDGEQRYGKHVTPVGR